MQFSSTFEPVIIQCQPTSEETRIVTIFSISQCWDFYVYCRIFCYVFNSKLKLPDTSCLPPAQRQRSEGGIVFSSVCGCVSACVSVRQRRRGLTLEPFEISSWKFYQSMVKNSKELENDRIPMQCGTPVLNVSDVLVHVIYALLITAFLPCLNRQRLLCVQFNNT